MKLVGFTEIKGKGIRGQIEGHRIQLGSLAMMEEEALYSMPKQKQAGFVNTHVYVSIDGEVKGYYRISNTYREKIGALIEELSGRYSMSVLSGDHEGERQSLQKLFPEGSDMLFNQKPEDKLQYINNLQKQGADVLMLGDGLNDAGALVKSNTGIAVTEDITSFTPASDAILDANKISDLGRFLDFSHTSKRIIYASFIISFLYNIIGMGFAVSGKLTPIIAAILMPASSITVVFFATFAVNTMAKIKKLI